MKNKKLKNKYKKIIPLLLIFLGIGAIIFSTFNIIKWYLANKENAKIKEELQKSIVIKKVENPENKEKTIEKYQIDFKTLKEKNNETIGYKKKKNTNIDYVVVQHSDNSYYLKHNFEKSWNNAGWIFADYHNKFDESDKNIVIYGHNTYDGSMFDTLKNTVNEEWYKNEDNHEFVFVTEKGTYHYQVFSTYLIKPEVYYINTEFHNNEEFDKFLKTIKSRSVYNYSAKVNNEDKILTLSSCIGDGSKRVVLHGKLINN